MNTLAVRIETGRKLTPALGVIPAIIYVVQRLRVLMTRTNVPYTLFSKTVPYPLKCRPNASDIDVFNDIFVYREYRCLDNIDEAGLIVDCGANVGYSSAYLLGRFPKARVIAIEPDPANFAMLEANLAPYKGRVRAVCSAVWSHPVGLVLSEATFGDGREWSRQVRRAKPNESSTITATDIGTLLRESGYERISILKIDIEGAESIVFSSNYEKWIEKVDNIVIELHGEACQSIFMRAISSQNFMISQCDELTVCKRSGVPPFR